MTRSGAALAGLLLASQLTACSSGSPLIPNESLQLTAQHSISLSTLATGALIVGAVQLVYDPLAPNWEIEETRLGEDSYSFALTMKRFHTGGAGESLQVLKRRAGQLQQALGYENYVLTEYTEGVESQTLGARRVAHGTIKLLQPQQADSFMQN